ncbi:MAG: hypothetical protein ABEH40_09265 [Haloferacaceae archaeon]
MAHLSDDRAQILLIGALAMAVAFVALALVLNSSVYVENLANRENVVVGGEGPNVYAGDVRRGVGRAVVAGNANGSTFADRTDDVETGVGTLRAALRAYHAERGVAVNVSVVDASPHTEGTRVFTTADGHFTEPNATSPDWTLGTDRRFRRFGMNVSRSGLASSTLPLSDVFRIEVEDADGDRWKIYVYRDDSAVPARTAVRVRDPTGSLSAAECEDDSGSRTDVNITAATVGGAHCDPLDFFEPPDGVSAAEPPRVADPPYTIRYRNAGLGNVSGRYRFVMDATSPAPDYAGDGDITTQEVVYDTTVEAVYHSADVRYVTEIRVAPGEPDA